jgi:hypothetical protein
LASSPLPGSAAAGDAVAFDDERVASKPTATAIPRPEDTTPAGAGERAVVPPERRTSAPSGPPEKPSSGLTRLLLTAAISVPLGLVGGVVGARLQPAAAPAAKGPASAPLQATRTASEPAPVAEDRQPGPSLESFNMLAERLGKIAADVTALEGQLARVESQKREPPGELGDFRAQLERLSATVSELAALPKETRKIDDDVLRLSGALANLNGEMVALRRRTDKLAAPQVHEVDHSVALAGAEAPPPGDELGPRLQAGINLFKQNRFRDALGVFNRLELTHPDDARVWYYAALCLGFSTGQWTGGTQQLVEKGIERERAGTPVAGIIDATFNELSPAQGRDWLGEYRRRAAAASRESAPGAASAAAPDQTAKD